MNIGHKHKNNSSGIMLLREKVAILGTTLKAILMTITYGDNCWVIVIQNISEI